MQRFRVLFANLPHNFLVSESKWNISVLYYTLVKIAVEFCSRQKINLPGTKVSPHVVCRCRRCCRCCRCRCRCRDQM